MDPLSSNNGISSRKSLQPFLNPWLIVTSSFLVHFLSCGICYAIGVYYVVVLEVFEESYGVTSWLGSLCLGTLCATGPLASLSIDKLGIRWTVQIGGLLAAGGFLSGAFSNNITSLFLSFGIITGVGYGFAFTSCIVVIGESLVRYRTLAMGVSISGIGFGHFCYPVLANFLMDIYGWRGALMITAGLTFNICLFGMFMPGKPPDKLDTTQNEAITDPAVVHISNGLHHSGIIHQSVSSLRNKPNIASALVFTGGSQPNLKMLKHGRHMTDLERAYSSELMYSMLGRTTSASYNSLLNLNKAIDINRNTEAQLASNKMLDQGKEMDEAAVAQQATSPNKLYSFTLFAYWLILINVLLYSLSQSVILTHIAAYSMHQGVSPERGVLLLSLCGGSGILGKVLLGAIASHPRINSYILYGSCYFIAGLALFGMIFWTSFAGLLTCVIVYGIFASAYGPVLSEVILEMVGLENFNYAYGFLMVFCAVGGTLGAPMAGWLYDATLFYQSSFYFGAGCLILSALLTIPLVFDAQCHRPQEAEDDPVKEPLADVI